MFFLLPIWRNEVKYKYRYTWIVLSHPPLRSRLRIRGLSVHERDISKESDKNTTIGYHRVRVDQILQEIYWLVTGEENSTKNRKNCAKATRVFFLAKTVVTISLYNHYASVSVLDISSSGWSCNGYKYEWPADVLMECIVGWPVGWTAGI